MSTGSTAGEGLDVATRTLQSSAGGTTLKQ